MLGKFALAMLFAASVAEAASVEPNIVGVLSKMNMTEEEFKAYMDSARESGNWTVFSDGTPEPMKFMYCNSLNAMQMALFVNEVDEILLPKIVGEYVLNTAKDRCAVSGSSRIAPACLAFGFRKSDGLALRDSFNKALSELKEDGTLAHLQTKYFTNPGTWTPEPVNFESFKDAGVVRVAVTGDLPPIDCVAINGTPAGFSTALLAEIGKRLHLNIRAVDIAAGTRAMFLASKQVDAVFWFQFDLGQDGQPDVPEDVALSDSYYEWNENLHIREK